MTFTGMTNYERHYDEATKNVFLPYLTCSAMKWNLRDCMRNFSENCFFIREKFKL